MRSRAPWWLKALALTFLVCCGCAHQRARYRDSPQFSVCQILCEDAGGAANVYEDDTEIECNCKKKPPDET